MTSVHIRKEEKTEAGMDRDRTNAATGQKCQQSQKPRNAEELSSCGLRRECHFAVTFRVDFWLPKSLSENKLRFVSYSNPGRLVPKPRLFADLVYSFI